MNHHISQYFIFQMTTPCQLLCCNHALLRASISLDRFGFEARLFIHRLKGDWDRQPVGMKTPWQYKTALPVHAASGAFIAIMDRLKSSIPKADFESVEEQLCQQFEVGILDADLIHFLENTVPPVDLHQVSFVRTSFVNQCFVSSRLDEE